MDQDSDQSEVIFSDDDDENVDSSIKFSETGPFSTSITHSPLLSDNSPCPQKSPSSAEIPTTPLSLVPYISKAQLWTSDLETPDVDSKKRTEKRASVDKVYQENQINSLQPVSKTPVTVDSPSSDEIIPASQESARKKRRKRPNRPGRRILSNTSKSCSDDDVRHCKNSKDHSNDADSDASNDRLSPIKEQSMEESFEDVRKQGCNSGNGNKSQETMSFAERMRQLRELKKSCTEEMDINVIDWPESEFVRTVRSLECSKQSFSLSQKKMETKPFDHVGLLRFSEMVKQDNHISQFDKSIGKLGEGSIDVQSQILQDFEENNDINGIDWPASESVRTVRNSECCQQSFSLSQKKMETKPFDHVGLLRSSEMVDQDNQISQFDKSIGKLGEGSIDVQSEILQDFVENKDLQGFSSYSQENSKIIHSKYVDFLSNEVHKCLQSSKKSWMNLNGFSSDEIEQSTNLAERFELFYNNYLEHYFPIAKKNIIEVILPQRQSKTNILAPIKMSLKPWWNTASGKELFVGVNTVSQAESWLLNDDFCTHGIERLQTEIEDSSNENVRLQDNQRNLAENCKKALITENQKKIVMDNSINFESHAIMNIKNEVDAKQRNYNASSESSLATTSFASQCQINNVHIKTEVDTQLMELIPDINNKENVNNFCESKNDKEKLRSDDITKIEKLFNQKSRKQLNFLKRTSLAENRCPLNGENIPYIPINSPISGIQGFQTGRDRQINVPEEALLKDKNIFAEEDNFWENEIIAEDLEFAQPESSKSVPSTSKINPNIVPNTRINFKETLAMPKNTFTNRTGITADLEFEQPGPSKEVPSTSIIHNFNKVRDNTRSNLKETRITPKNILKNRTDDVFATPNTPMLMGFQTGRGNSIKVSEKAFSKGKNNFADEDLNLERFPIYQPTIEFGTGHQKSANEPENVISTEPMLLDNFTTLGDVSEYPATLGFVTGRGKNINISANALSNVKVQFSDDLDDVSIEMLKHLSRQKIHPQESSARLTSSIDVGNLRKRKHYIDEDTPVGRKRTRMGLDLQKRKLFDGIEEEDETLVLAAMEFDDCNVNNDRNFSKINLQPVMTGAEMSHQPSATVIMDEVHDSIEAFIREETKFNEIGDKWLNNEDNASRKLQRNTSEGSFSDTRDDKINAFISTKRPRSYPGSSEPITTTDNLKSPVKSPKYDSIPEELFFDTQFSQEISNYSAEQLQEQRCVARLEQEKIILSKKRNKVKPLTGSLLTKKQINTQISLKSYFSCSRTLRSNQSVASIMSINSSSAAEYQFNLVKFYGQTFMMNHAGGVPVGDGAILIPNDGNLATVAEFKQSFLASPGVDPSLVPNRWVDNHYRWIIWKLASMERYTASRKLSTTFLTPDGVMKQLKYRYDREIDRSERPALRRILEKDDVPSRRMVLCVSKVTDDNLSQENKSRTIELTDGWYCVPAIVDCAMVPYINMGKIKEGTKLMIFGADLLNHEEGHYPLDITCNVRLRIHTNSTRRARWDAKLGYQRQCGPMKTTLKSIKSTGGFIGKFTVTVARVYPLLFREKIPNGETIIRNARCEEKAAIAFEQECQSKIESICLKSMEAEDVKYELETMKNNLHRRDVTPFLKIKIADGSYSALLCVWSCNEDTQDRFKENSCIIIYNATAISGINELHITAGRSMTFERAPLDCSITCPPRVLTFLDDINQEFNPEYREFDTIGIVVSVGPAPHGMKNFETVNIAFRRHDDEESPSSYLSILFWEGISSHGFAEIATVGSFIACVNLEWRTSTYKSIPVAYCNERTILTRNPRQSYLRHEFEAFCARIKVPSAYIESCATIIQHEIEKISAKLTPMSRSSINSDRRASNVSTPENKVRSIADSDSVPKSDKQKINAMNRLKKLKYYGDAPDLSPIHFVRSSRVSADYKSPVAQLSKSSKT